MPHTLISPHAPGYHAQHASQSLVGQLGLVAGHQDCQKPQCQDQLSRKHAIECAGIRGTLELLVGSVPLEKRVGKTGIDVLLNTAADTGLSTAMATAIVEIIEMIERVCWNRKRSKMGFLCQDRAQVKLAMASHLTDS